MRVMQEDLQRVSAENEDVVYKWKRERSELLQRIAHNIQSYDAAKDNSSALK
jgi:hypothetical protein